MRAPVTLITGASRGIGLHLSEHYLALDHRVIGCSRGESGLVHDGYTHASVDVSDEPEVKALFSRIRREHGRLDHLINNAGVASMNHCLLTPISTVERLFATNAIATFLFSCEAAKLMKNHGYGRIVNFTSVAVPLKLEGEAAYAASKAAVQSFTEVLARELASFGVTVNAVGPPPIATDLIKNVPQDKIQAVVERQAIPRLGTVEDVANVVDFFLRPSSGFVTGQIVFLGGV